MQFAFFSPGTSQAAAAKGLNPDLLHDVRCSAGSDVVCKSAGDLLQSVLTHRFYHIWQPWRCLPLAEVKGKRRSCGN